MKKFTRQELVNIKKEISDLGTVYSNSKVNRGDNALDLNEKVQGLAEVTVALKLLDGLSMPLSSMRKEKYLYALVTLELALSLVKETLKANDEASKILEDVSTLASKVTDQLMLKQD